MSDRVDQAPTNWEDTTPVVSERAYRRKISDEIEVVLGTSREPDERPSTEPPTAEQVEEGIYQSCRLATSNVVRRLKAQLGQAEARAQDAEARAVAAERRERQLARELKELQRGIGGG